MPSAASSVLTPASLTIVVSGLDAVYFDSGLWWKMAGADGTWTLNHVSGSFYALHTPVQFGNGAGNPPATHTSDYSLAVAWTSTTGFFVSGTLEDGMGDFDFGGSLSSATPPLGAVACATGQSGRSVSYSISSWQ